MADEERLNLQSDDAQANVTDETVINTQAASDDSVAKKGKGGKKSKGEKAPKPTKEEKAASKIHSKEVSRAQKQWEESIVSNKRVKREENRRKLKKAMLFLLVFALVTTSIVYVMLLFIQENNVRITASSNNRDKSISLSMDNYVWTPYLNAGGPEQMWDVSYNQIYDREPVPTIGDVQSLLESEYVFTGNFSNENYISFCFMLRNDSSASATVAYNMNMSSSSSGLQNAIRVMWGESYKNTPGESTVDVYATLSNNPRLMGTQINQGRIPEQGFYEYVAYPIGSDQITYNLLDYENSLDTDGKREAAVDAGYFRASAFYNDEYVLQDSTILEAGDIMYVFVAIWIEGSDFDCVDSALGGHVTLGINFTVIE